MSLPDNVAIKFGAYTLYCREFLKRLSALNEAVANDTRLSYEDCIARLDESLKEFFEQATPVDLPEAVENLGGLIHGKVGLFRRKNRKAATVFNEVVSNAEQAVHTWRYEDDVETYHRQGREIAQRFFASTTWSETRTRLARVARLVHEYGILDTEDIDSIGRETSGYGATPIAYHPNHVDNATGKTWKDVIVVRVGFDFDFGIYLAFPFLFLHEYSAHIFAADHGNDLFNDGWMLHAAQDFLVKDWIQSGALDFLHRRQIYAFENHLNQRSISHAKIRSSARKGYDLAKHFAEAFAGILPGRFEAFTFELAAFNPSKEDIFWPTLVLGALEREFDSDRVKLRRKIETSSSLRDLWRILEH